MSTYDWWDVDELLGDIEEDDSATDNLTEAEQALIDRVNELKTIVDTEITQPYPVAGVSADYGD